MKIIKIVLIFLIFLEMTLTADEKDYLEGISSYNAKDYEKAFPIKIELPNIVLQRCSKMDME